MDGVLQSQGHRARLECRRCLVYLWVRITDRGKLAPVARPTATPCVMREITPKMKDGRTNSSSPCFEKTHTQLFLTCSVTPTSLLTDIHSFVFSLYRSVLHVSTQVNSQGTSLVPNCTVHQSTKYSILSPVSCPNSHLTTFAIKNSNCRMLKV